MNDELDGTVIERLLRRYQVAGPPLDLRRRITAHANTPRQDRVLEWLPALATAALIVILYTLAATARAEIVSRLPTPDNPEPIERLFAPNEETRP